MNADMHAKPDAPVAKLKNIGPASAAWLQKAGICRVRDVQKLGAVAAYWRVKQREPRACLMLLYALEAGLRGVAPADLPPRERSMLKSAAALYGGKFL
ncbi:MAG: TfoX/Sxy family protein [Gammaproteobacteria bacterium]